VALVLLGHGSTRNCQSSTTTDQQAETLRRRGAFAEVAEGFEKEEPPFSLGLNRVLARRVFVVPFFASEGYFTEEVIRRSPSQATVDEAADELACLPGSPPSGSTTRCQTMRPCGRSKQSTN
jgi:sirohydrochlorin ferrochelatase